MLKVTVPCRLLGRIFSSDWHVCAVLHESFPAWEANVMAPECAPRIPVAAQQILRYNHAEFDLGRELRKQAAG